MPDFRIVEVQVSDLDRYLNLLEDVNEWLNARGIGELQSETYRSSRKHFAESIERGEVYWGLLGEELVGTIRLLPEDREVWPEITKQDALYVYNLVVSRAWAGQRLGLRMLGWAETQTQLSAREYVRLDCFANNNFLRRYYAEAGFTERGEVDAEYPDPVGTLRLRRFEKRVSTRQ